MIKKVSHIILASILLIATVGLTINLHYCAGDLYSIGIDSKAKNCCQDEGHFEHTMDMDHEAVCNTNGNDTDNCDDETTIVKVSDCFTKTVQQKNINNNLVIVLFNALFQDNINCFAENTVELNCYNSYNSPPTTRQFLSLHQVYLL